MKTPLIWKIREAFKRFIMNFTGHTYGCCDRIFRRCSNCKYEKGENTDVEN